MIILKKDTGRKLPVLMVDSGGQVKTGITEGSVTVVTSKNGGSLTGFTLTGLWAELGQGLYTINFASGDLNTEGFFAYLVTVTGCDQYSGIMYVSDWETNVDSILEDTATTLDGKINTIDTNVDSILEDTATTLPTALTTHDTEVKAAITATEGNIRGADSDTLKTLSEQVDEAQDELDTLPDDPADESLLEAAITAAEGNIRGTDSDDLKALSDQLDSVALEATLTAIKGDGWTDENLTTIDSLIDAIKAKTDNLPVDPADESLLEAAITVVDGRVQDMALGVITQIQADITAAEGNVRGTDDDTLKILSEQMDVAQADLDDPDQYKADVTALALEASLDDVDVDLTTLKEAVAYIKQKESGRWKIENYQLTYYDADGVTVLKRFNLFNKEGQAANENPYERVPV